MAKELTDEDRAFRRLVTEHDGKLQDIADALQVSRYTVSRRLWTEKHSQWWRSFKAARSKRRAAAAKRRYVARARERAAGAWGPGSGVE